MHSLGDVLTAEPVVYLLEIEVLKGDLESPQESKQAHAEDPRP